MLESRMTALRSEMGKSGVDVAVITDDDNVYYLTGYYDYLHMEFGRPTILIVPKDGPTLLITPTIDLNSAKSSARVDRISAWNDGMGQEWREELPAAVKSAGKVGIEPGHMPAPVRTYVDELVSQEKLCSVTPILTKMRMIKSPFELQLARHAGEVASTMVAAGRDTIADGVPEYEVAIATSQAGTRKAAELLAAHYEDTDMSPNMHFLQILASGDQLVKTHHRATNRIMRKGEPVFMCFCGLTNFHRFKVGFDRMFWIGEPDPKQVAVYEVAVASQKAALNALKPGVTAESIHAEYAEVIQGAGFDYPFRCGRATGFSFLESPQLVTGDDTVIQPGMVFAVDGAVATDSFRAQVGDTFIVTEDGWEQVTHHPKTIDQLVL